MINAVDRSKQSIILKESPILLLLNVSLLVPPLFRDETKERIAFYAPDVDATVNISPGAIDAIYIRVSTKVRKDVSSLCDFTPELTLARRRPRKKGARAVARCFLRLLNLFSRPSPWKKNVYKSVMRARFSWQKDVHFVKEKLKCVKYRIRIEINNFLQRNMDLTERRRERGVVIY